MGIAGVYARWKKPGGGDFFSFAMLTLNADNHPFIKPFHKPGEEKRMVVILDPKDYYAWLSVPVDQAKGYFKQWRELWMGIRRYWRVRPIRYRRP